MAIYYRLILNENCANFTRKFIKIKILSYTENIDLS